jgi:hypothetical protein
MSCVWSQQLSSDAISFVTESENVSSSVIPVGSRSEDAWPDWTCTRGEAEHIYNWRLDEMLPQFHPSSNPDSNLDNLLGSVAGPGLPLVP